MLIRRSRIYSILIIFAALTAIALPMLAYSYSKLTPVLNMTKAMVKPEAMTFDSMEIVEVEYVNDDPNNLWESMTIKLGLKFHNKLEDPLIVPSANMTLNFLDEKLGDGWISKDYKVYGGKKEVIDAYLKVKNDRIWSAFLKAMLLGKPLALAAGFEAYILIEGPTGDEFFPLTFPTQLDFAFPAGEKGIPPFIWSIMRGPVSSNQPVSISVNATDKGTGISNRTYIKYSTNGGTSWVKTPLTGGNWTCYYDGVPLGYAEKTGVPWLGTIRFPITSVKQQETYQGEIPGFSAGTTVLYKIYLEDYAGNIEHEKTANWVESQIYSYVVPSTTPLSEFYVEFSESLEETFLEKFMDYLEEKGIHIEHYLYLRGINQVTQRPFIAKLADYFYAHDVDSNYALGLLTVDMGFVTGILADSGVSAGNLLQLLDIDFDDFWDYVAHHIFLPTEQDLTLLGKERFNEIMIIDDIQTGIGPPNWNVNASGSVSECTSNVLTLNGEKIPADLPLGPGGSKSLNWTTSTPENLVRNFSSTPTRLSRNFFLTFYMDHEDTSYDLINGNISISFMDNSGRKMTSKKIQFANSSYGTWQEIALYINSIDFAIAPGFNFNEIHFMNFTYGGTQEASIYIDYICQYSPHNFEWHQIFTYNWKVRNFDFNHFLDWIFQGTHWNPVFNWQWPLIKDMGMEPFPPSWVPNPEPSWGRTSFWNFLKFIETNDPEKYKTQYQVLPNHHLLAANLFIEWMGSKYFYEDLVAILDAEIETAPDPIEPEEIYPYTQNLVVMMVYIPLGVFGSFVVLKKLQLHQRKKKAIKIKNKHKKT
ncbi:MAG: hypothetical protein ACFE8A_09670 [Candidatus Hodarchaeota archaeon]